MVDPTTGLGPVQGVASNAKSQSTKNVEKRDDGARRAEPRDEVRISKEAQEKQKLDEQQAKQAAEEARDQLARDDSFSFGLNPAFVDEVA